MSQFRTDVGREFQRGGAAVLKERLLKGTFSSVAGDDRSGRVLLRVVMWQLRYSGSLY